MQQPQAQHLIAKLLVPEDAEFQQSWSQFFLSFELVRQVLPHIQPDQVPQLLAAGQAYSGGGWTTSKAAKSVFELTQVSLVTSDFSMYRAAFLFSLALILGVEVPELNLTDRAAEAAFGLAHVFGQDPNSSPEEPQTEPQEEDVGQSTFLSWDEPLEPLPPDFQLIWQGVRAGTRRLDLRSLLQNVPRYTGLPEQAPLNNHRKDAKSKVDTHSRSWQQSVLHSLRLVTRLYTAEDEELAVPLIQQIFQLQAELYGKIENFRREYSLPGSVGPSGPPLFQKEELNNAAMVQKINRGNALAIYDTSSFYLPFSSVPPGYGNRYQSYSSGYGSRSFGYGSRFRYNSKGTTVQTTAATFPFCTGGKAFRGFSGRFGKGAGKGKSSSSGNWYGTSNASALNTILSE